MNQQETPKQTTEKPKKESNKLLWTVIFILIAAASIWAVISQSKSFTMPGFIDYIKNANPFLLAVAVCCMLIFIVFEGEAVLCICRAFGFKRKHKQGFIYSASDIYFSSITPSATGGQPACAYFMMKDGIPGTVVTVALLVNLVMYTAAILFISLIGLIFRSDIFFSFSIVSRVLIVGGFLMQGGLMAALILLLTKPNIMRSIANKAIHLLCKIKIFKNEESKKIKINKSIDEYADYASMIKGKNKMLISAFILNLIQRVGQISVSAFVFLAAGGLAEKAFDIFTMQSFTVIGSNLIPIPGAMGITDYLMLDCFGSILTSEQATNLELLSRTLSFYVCILICGITVLIKYIIQRRKNKKC